MPKPLCAIVGAGNGLGSALAAKFASHGFDLALISRDHKNSMLAIESASLAANGVDIRFYSADAKQPETIEVAFSTIVNQMREIDLLIYNVRGKFTACQPLDMSYTELEDIYSEEVIGAFAAAKSVLPSMITRTNGSIFFSSATAAFRGSSTYPLYSIGKFGLRALSQSLAKAYAKDGVHIVHFRLDCNLDVPIMHEIKNDPIDRDALAVPGGVAETYWLTYQQPKSAWSNEVEIRPYGETWTY